MADGLLALTWNNHSSTFSKTISSLRIKERYTDATITCEGKFYQVHKFVLATCSEYFEKIFEETPCKHPVIVLRDVSCDELEALLNYMYIGSVSVAQNDLSRLIKVAELLKIKGLAVPDDPPTKSNDIDAQLLNSERSPYARSKHAREGDDDFTNPRAKRARSHDGVIGSHYKSTTQSDASSSGQPFNMCVKDEVEEIGDSDSIEQESLVETQLEPKSEGDDISQGNQSLVHDNSQIGTPYVTSSDSQDVPSDNVSLAQAVMGHHTFSEDLVALAGPSDAQEWYSEGNDTSGGLPIGKGAVGDQGQDLLPMEGAQHPSQRMVGYSSNVFGERNTLGISKEALERLYQSKYVARLSQARERRFQCSSCSSTFSEKFNLKAHEKLHTGEKPFACTECDYRGARKHYLDSHMAHKHRKL